MLLRMVCLNEQMQEEIWSYDNETNVIYKPNGDRFDPSENSVLDRYKEIRSKRLKGVSDTKSNKVRTLKIQLGLKCNMNCSYCVQGKTESVTCSPKDVNNFLNLLDDNEIDVERIVEFWGGEPLVYWKTLKDLMPKINKRHDGIKFKIITNGTLLDKEKIDFFRQFNTVLICSHDADGYCMRGDDPLNNPKILEAWRYANENINFCINCVLTPANADVSKIIPFFKKKFGDDINVNIEGPMTHTSVVSEEVMFSKESLKTMHDSIFNGLLKDDRNVWDLFFGRVSANIISLARNVKVDPMLPRCSSWNEDSLAVNLKGDVLACHNFGDKQDIIGHISSLKDVHISNKLIGWSQREKCQDCFLVSECMGGCPYSSGLGWSMSCKNYFTFHSAIFEFSWLFVTKRILIGVYRQQ